VANASLSREHVLDELEFLATVEHALIVEYLSVCCALGHDLEAGEGGPATESGRAGASVAAGSDHGSGDTPADGKVRRSGEGSRATLSP
jgi:hypothetical protein